MRILITGGTGFIGSNLLKNNKFYSDNEILVLSRKSKPKNINKKINWIKSDLGLIKKEHKKIKKFNPDTILHFAWEGIPDFSKKKCEINFLKQKKFIQYVTNYLNIKKIIVSGSCFEYGTVNNYCNESKIFLLQNNFSKTKLKIYKYFKSNTHSKKINLIWLRIFFVYGPNQRPGSLIPYLIKNFKNGNNVRLKNPYEKKDFIYISDLIDSLFLFLKIQIDGIFNIGSGKCYSAYYISKKLKKIMNSPSKIIIDKTLKNKNYKFHANMSKTKKAIKWKPKFNILKGLNKSFIISKKNVSTFK